MCGEGRGGGESAKRKECVERVLGGESDMNGRMWGGG